MREPTPGQQRRRQRERRVVLLTLAVCLLLASAVYAWVYGPACLAYWEYKPQEGDIVFQSSPRSRLVNTIERVSESPFSHCAIVANVDGRWVVYEAYDNVEVTPLREFVFRGRNQAFAVCRLKQQYQPHVAATLAHAREYLGRPYDARYRMDDELIYCSELIYKAFEKASGGQLLGELVRLGDMNWQPYAKTIEHFEGGPVPLERRMITPKHLAVASQLEPIYSFRFEATR